MKRLLTAAAMAITLSGAAQSSWPITIDSSSERFWREDSRNYIDTVPALFLLCDTLYTKTVFYEKGYEVLKMIYTNYGLVSNGDGNVYVSTSKYESRHIMFLNAQKKPFGKSIIIWETKRIKP